MKSIVPESHCNNFRDKKGILNCDNCKIHSVCTEITKPLTRENLDKWIEKLNSKYGEFYGQ